MPEHTEQELLQQIAVGNESAFRELFLIYRRKLFTYVYKITESREIADDTVQDIFLHLWSVRETLPRINHINAYLYKMAHNYAYQGFRRLAKEELLLDHLKKQAYTPNNPAQELVSKEVTAYIQSLVDRLTPQQRNVFLLSREEGLKQEEIADRLNISIFTVKKHMVDALSFLREEIRQNYGSYAIALFVIYQL